MELELDKRLFNKIYFNIQKYLSNKDIRHIWVYGGSSSSKTYSVVQATIINMLSDKDYNTMVFRKYLSDIKNSIFTDFKNIIRNWELDDFFTIQQNLIICNVTGNYVVFKGLDSDEKIKGLTGIKKIIIDEINQVEFEIYKQIKKRIRGKEGQQIISLFNPVSELSYIKKDIFDKDEFEEIESDISSIKINKSGDVVILHTNYLDNEFIVGPRFVDKHTIADFEKDKKDDYAYYKIYALGEWGSLKTGGEFLKKFDSNKHIQDINWDKSLPLHLSFDENVNPYLTLMIFQIDGKSIRQIDEICLEDPKNTLADTINEFKVRYPSNEVSGLFLTGDRTSIKADVKLEKGQNFFTIIQNYLTEYKPRLRIGTSNPSVVVSGGFFNSILDTEFGGISIVINVNCKRSINDYIHCLEDSDGTVKKTKKTNPVTKVTYEEFGHHIDGMRYLLVNTFPSEYQLYQNGNRVGSSIRMGKTSKSRHIY